MPSRSLIHITTTGERWDSIAWTYYGDATLYSHIIMANPDIAIAPAFDAGISITIPVLEVAKRQSAALPPWKRPR